MECWCERKECWDGVNEWSNNESQAIGKMVRLTLCCSPCLCAAALLVASLPQGSHRRLGRQGVVVVGCWGLPLPSPCHSLGWVCGTC